MDYLTIDGVKPYDGRYEFDLENRALTTREWGWIKRHSGYLPLTIDEGFRGADPELYAVFAVVALHRAGKIDARDAGDMFERLADAPFGATITLEGDPGEGDDADPPGAKWERERELQWERFADEFGDIASPPEQLWNFRVGRFGVAPSEVGNLTPSQLLECVEAFRAMYEARE